MQHFKNNCKPQHLTFGHDGSRLYCMNCGAIEPCGYYKTASNTYSPELHITVFGRREGQVLVKDIGLSSYSWINIHDYQYVPNKKKF